MPKQLLTLVLDSPQIGLKEFSEAVGRFRALIDTLSQEHAKHAQVQWIIHTLEIGSATAVVRGIPKREEDLASVEHVVNAYENVGRMVSQRNYATLSPQVAKHARSLANLVTGGIRAIRLETEADEVEILPFSGETQSAPLHRTCFGCVKGRIQTVTNRQGLRFTLYDLSTDKPVSCYLVPGSEEIMRGAWGHIAIIEGEIRRNPQTGYAQTIRQVRQVEIVSEGDPGDFRQARGALAFTGEPAEVTIRRIRDN